MYIPVWEYANITEQRKGFRAAKVTVIQMDFEKEERSEEGFEEKSDAVLKEEPGEQHSAQKEADSQTQEGVSEEDGVKYAFRWDYQTEYEAERNRQQKASRRARRLYTLIVVSIFVTALALLTAVCILGR